MNTNTTRRRRSVALGDQLWGVYKRWLSKQDTLIDAAEYLDISIPTLISVKFKGTASPDTVAKIQTRIPSNS